ncbi:pyrroloquinoline quinone biosynthesis protein PqqB [Rhizobium sp. TRM95111]|uniref:pyrroloquinoline quinone biosynthesis protein PqqB n=1 Tax=Rhizobium alarense TaxID=2846851 RepID=UPI001F37C7CE|nr:pyrroloquinoline quinone biosynthesis protein PqqB [Rhizobium alarense]MCF3639637.1 pyrroloquinoline quinone biosynthesis protein PqqB [Rhizobium alarense]
MIRIPNTRSEDAVRIVILGAGAGGGLPQWNCGCVQCTAARKGLILPMTQSTLAVSADGVDWVLLNASPDLRHQLAACTSLHPTSLRSSPVKAVVLTNGDVDHIAGLLTLREKTALTLYATDATHRVLSENTVFGVLDPTLIERKTVVLDQPFSPRPGLTITPYAVPGKIPLYLEGETPDLEMMGEQTVGLRLQSEGHDVHYLPGCAALPDWLVAQLEHADLVLFDGTIWSDDEMLASGTGSKTGARMGHVAMSGPDGSLERLSGLRGRRLYTHVNNTNSALMPESDARAAITAAGWEIARDGMEIVL